jgi:hypothetical protein
MRTSIFILTFCLGCQNQKDFEYIPTYVDKRGHFFQSRDSLTDKHKQSIKKVLDYYGHEFEERNDRIYYKGKLEQELIWNYTMKANDSVWLYSHQPK